MLNKVKMSTVMRMPKRGQQHFGTVNYLLSQLELSITRQCTEITDVRIEMTQLQTTLLDQLNSSNKHGIVHLKANEISL